MASSYAGVGSRDTPPDVLKSMRCIGQEAYASGWVLRSGGARGADTAFMEGARKGAIAEHVAGNAPPLPLALIEKAEIYLPWDGFNHSYVDTEPYCVDCQDLSPALREAAATYTCKYHPNAKALGSKAKLFMDRNAYQVMGSDLHTPCDRIICWTPGGQIEGGTGQALRIAQEKGIEIYNLYFERHQAAVMALIMAHRLT